MFSPVRALQSFLYFLKRLDTRVQERGQKEETNGWRFEAMGKREPCVDR